MKLLRFGPAGSERPGMLDAEGRVRDLSGVIADLTGATIGPEGLAKLAALAPKSLPVIHGAPRLGPCVRKVSKFVAVGLNYADHAAESNRRSRPSRSCSTRPPPASSVRMTTSCCRRTSVKLIGKSNSASSSAPRRAMLRKAHALEYVAGFCVITTFPSANTRSSAAASGPRARAATHSAPSAPGW